MSRIDSPRRSGARPARRTSGEEPPSGRSPYLDQDFTFLYKDDAEAQANHFFCESGNSGGVWYDRGNVAYGSNKDKLIYVDGDSRKSVLPVPPEVENVTFASYNVFARVSNDTILYLPAVEPKRRQIGRASCRERV